MYEQSAGSKKVSGRKRENPLRERNVWLRREGYKQEERAEILGGRVRTIQEWDRLDRLRKCVRHVLTKELMEGSHRINIEGGILSETIVQIEVRRCRYCLFEERRRNFGQIYRRTPND